MLRVHRLFLHPQIPGFWSPQGTICLPLKLDGSFTDKNPFSDSEFPWRKAKEVENYFFRQEVFFANRSPKLKLCLNEAEFRRRYHPDWIEQAVRTVEGEAKTYLRLSSAGHYVAPFVERLEELSQILSGFIYRGSRPAPHKDHSQSFLVYPQDLFLYGEPLVWGGLEKPLMGLLFFLEAALFVNAQMRTGIAGKVNVAVHPGRIPDYRELKDPIETIHAHHIRPQQNVHAKRDGSIELNHLSSYTMPDDSISNHWNDQREQVWAILGFYLFASNHLSLEEIRRITDKAASNNLGKRNSKDRKFTNWLRNFLVNRKRGIDADSVDHQVFLMSHSFKRLIMH